MHSSNVLVLLSFLGEGECNHQTLFGYNRCMRVTHTTEQVLPIQSRRFAMSEGNICDLNCIMEQYTGKNIIYNTKIMHKEAIFTPSTLCTGKNRVPGTVP